MASSSSSFISICISSSSIPRACSSQHITNKKQATQVPKQARSTRSNHTASADIEPLKLADISPQLLNKDVYENKNSSAEISSYPRFSDERWRNGTWDLNMFVKKGKMDWDTLIEAEAKRRRFLELYPEASSNKEPVLFRSSIIPWWAWILHSHLPEAELLNGRAAMLGFFTAYTVDALTGINVVGQMGNFICKAALFVTVIGILVFRKKEDFEYVRNLADEATFYDKQWQASWQNTHVVKDKLQK